jgi:hypothetical protein
MKTPGLLALALACVLLAWLGGDGAAQPKAPIKVAPTSLTRPST